MSSPFPLRASAVLVFALSLAACTDPIAPTTWIDRPPPAVLLRAGTAYDLQLCIDDALERITPTLEKSDELDRVTTSLLVVASALKTREPPKLVGAARSFKDAVDKYISAVETRGQDPDAAVLRLLSEDLEAVALYPPLDTLRTN